MSALEGPQPSSATAAARDMWSASGDGDGHRQGQLHGIGAVGPVAATIMEPFLCYAALKHDMIGFA